MFKKTVLKNGLRIITVPSKNSKSAAILVMVAAGSKYERKNQNGISHFLEHMFFKGTKKRQTPLELAEVLDRVGGIYNAFTTKEYTGYFAKVEAHCFDLALDWVSDIFLNSTLEPKAIEREKGVIIEEINMYLDTPSQDVSNVFEELLYQDQPAGLRVIGSKENITNFQRQDFIDYLKNHYSALNTIVCAAGYFDEERAIEKIEKSFKGISKNILFPKIKTEEKQEKPEVLLKFKQTDQAHLCLGVRAYDMFSPKRYIQEILAVVLGGNMSSRLFIEVREKKGLAYYINTMSETYTDTGYLMTQAGVPCNKTKKVVDLILREYKRAALKGIKEKELQKAKDYLKGVLTLGLETSDAQASFFGIQELFFDKIFTLEEKLALINKVSLTDVKQLAEDVFKPRNLNLALITPTKETKEFEKSLDSF